MNQAEHTEQFVRRLTEHQNRLYGYIYSLLGDHARTEDVLQETNLVLWRKVDEFQHDKPFLPWAFAIARFQVLAHIRDRKRDRVLLDAELAETIGEEAVGMAQHFEPFREALRACLRSLSSRHRELIEGRYFRSQSISELAEALQQSVSAVKVALLRARRQLADCAQNRLRAEE